MAGNVLFPQTKIFTMYIVTFVFCFTVFDSGNYKINVIIFFLPFF